MGDNGIQTGWQRFLERLRRLWPKQSDGRSPLPT
jgi:hypothetical protein